MTLNVPVLKSCLWIVPAIFLGPAASAHNVDDPMVLGMVAGGVSSLEANADAQPYYKLDLVFSGGHGELCLSGYAHMKVHHNPDSPVVKRGVQAALEYLGMIRTDALRDFAGAENKSLYTVVTAVLVLAEVDRKRYRPQLIQYEGFIRGRRSSNGMYAYPKDDLGDVSQTQYAILALWTLDRAGIKIDYEGVAATVNWLLRVQDPSGGWPYRGIDAGSNGRVKQSAVTPSMAIAGGSALMMGADILRVWGEGTAEDATNIKNMPKAVRLFKEDLVIDDTPASRPQVDAAPLRQSIADCQNYISQPSNSPDPAKVPTAWPYYQLYTLERYESFREVMMGKEDYKPLPGWYDIGVNYLSAKQEAGKGWAAQNYSTPSVSASFAVLFLIRGTKKAIEQVESGTTKGGWKLPSDTTQIVVEGTQIKGKEVSAAVDGLLDVLEGNPDEELEGKSIPEDLQLATEPKERAAQIDRLERLLRGSKSWQARRVAARILGQSDEHRVVPTLIYALSDPDSMVKIYARDGLRFISRKFEGFGMPSKPDGAEIRRAQNQWRDWYRSTNPGYVFLDYDY